MGIRFDLSTANWIAYLTEPGAPLPTLKDHRMEREVLSHFLYSLQYRFYSSAYREDQFRGLIQKAQNMLDVIEGKDRPIPTQIFKDIRAFLRDKAWTALIIPTGQVWDIDNYLCSESLLRSIIDIPSSVPGLILQLDGPAEEIFSLTDVFPAFRSALAESINWPGILFWNSSSDSVFLPLPENDIERIKEAVNWIFAYLAHDRNANLSLLLQRYYKQFPASKIDTSSILHILHLSDVHVGSKEARRRMHRIPQLMRNVLSELGSNARVIPVITGDLIQSPNEKNVDMLRTFMEATSNLCTEELVVALGNHDVRRGGYLDENARTCMRINASSGRVIWYDNYGVALICFNSVTDGLLARGFIGEPQFVDIGNQIDNHPDWRKYKFIALLHHHPTPVELPSWYSKPFYEKIIGRSFELTEELKDSQPFLDFVDQRSISAILHGHRHIPRLSVTPDGRTPIFGCGSSVGKVKSKDGKMYLSINVISIDTSRNRIAGRLLAETVPGGGLMDYIRHQFYRTTPPRHELVFRKNTK